MVDNDLLSMVELYIKTNLKDKDLMEDLMKIGEVLEKNLIILTSFEKYVKELLSGQLEWGPVHKDKFWKNNIKKFEDNDFHLIKKIIDLIKSKQSSEKTIAIACYDIGEFARFHTWGKR